MKTSLFISNLKTGGAQRVAVNLANGLSELGHAVDLILVNQVGNLQSDLDNSINIVNLNSSGVHYSVPKLVNYLNSNNPDALVSFMTYINVFSLMANNISSSNTDLILTEHNNPKNRGSGFVENMIVTFAKYGYKYADSVVAVSNGVRDNFKKEIADVDIDVIYNPIVSDSIHEMASEPVDHDWLKDQSKQVILSAGRHVPQKDFSTLIKSFNNIESNGDVRLILLGDGPSKTKLKKQVDGLGLEESVDFPGFVDNPFKYMANADVFVLSSAWEGFGNVLVEAMACGCPVVSTNCESGPSEILEGGKYGQLVPVGDHQTMAKSIEKTLSDPIDERIIKERSEQFSVENISSEYDKLIQKVLSS